MFTLGSNSSQANSRTSYTHYWNSIIWGAKWPQFLEDAKLIAAEAGVPLSHTGASDDPPVFDEQRIFFNGSPGDDFETFELYSAGYGGRGFCKTGRRPYDVVVAAILLRAFMVARMHVGSDGLWDGDWDEARELVGRLWPDEKVKCPWMADAEEEQAEE
ncbi:hypothetical protein NX059_011565 [Plenodomus lindquistii]|nr:hypothetical protein NX059_011565 [Plenodomus lindquistii]